MIKTSRDARKVLNQLQELTNKEPSFEDIFLAEELTFSFYAKTVCSAIKRYYNPDSKGDPNSLSFYVKPIKSINKGRRSKEDWQMDMNDKMVYRWVGQFILEDYSYDMLKTMRELCRYRFDDVEQATKVSKSEDVYSIPYILRVVEGIKARREHKQQQIQQMRKMFHVKQDEGIVVRGPAEIASAKHSWQELLQNSELQQRVNRLYGGDDHGKNSRH